MPTKDRVPWNLDFKPQKGDVTGANVVKKGLSKLTKGAWIDRRTGRRISRKKLPRTLCDFARLNAVEQSHILSIIYGDKGRARRVQQFLRNRRIEE